MILQYGKNQVKGKWAGSYGRPDMVIKVESYTFMASNQLISSSEMLHIFYLIFIIGLLQNFVYIISSSSGHL